MFGGSVEVPRVIPTGKGRWSGRRESLSLFKWQASKAPRFLAFSRGDRIGKKRRGAGAASGGQLRALGVIGISFVT